jgi:hypothetical protein
LTRWSDCTDPLRLMFGRVRVNITWRRAEMGDATASWVSDELPGALAPALSSAGRARVPVTVRIHAVILGPSSSDQGPNTSPDLARTGSNGVPKATSARPTPVFARPSAETASRSQGASRGSLGGPPMPRESAAPLVWRDTPGDAMRTRPPGASRGATRRPSPTGPWQRRIRLRRYRRTGRRARGTPRSEGAAS